MEQELTLVEHLGELRKRIIVSLVTLGIALAVSFPLSSRVLKFLKLPAGDTIQKLVFFSPQEAFLAYFRIAFFCALVISMPMILYQIWLFVSPAIEERRRKLVVYFVLFSSLSFLLGCLFAYFFLIPSALKFLLAFAKDELEPVISVGRYISFVTAFILGCGLVFQMPNLSYLLTKLGVIRPDVLRKKYK